MSDQIPHLNTALAGRYRIERELGKGGMATVYLADDLKHERKVALKVLKPEVAAVVGADRFLAEIKTTANLQHPHILPLFDSGEADSFLFYVMPYVEGETLRDKLEGEHQLPVDEAVRIASDVAEALQVAHEQGVIHRDIKPANILLSRGRPLIADFGIALALGAAGGGRLTETGLSLGTPHYMSPEQATGDLRVGAATDVYALGCVLFEMLIGEPPYTGSTPQAVLGKIIAGDTPSAVEQRRSVPPHVDAAITRALERLPADRFRSLREMSIALGDTSFRHGRVGTADQGGARTGWSVASLVLGGAAVLFAALWALEVRRSAPPSFYHIRFPAGQEMSTTEFGPLDWGHEAAIAFSPEGDRMVYPGPGGLLWRKERDRPTATSIPGTEGAVYPIFSPDGQAIAFFTQSGELRVASLAGGPSRILVPAGIFIRAGGAWSSDGYLYYTARSENSDFDFGIRRLRADGVGDPEPLTQRRDGEIIHVRPEPLPGGNKLLIETEGSVFMVDIRSRERHHLTEGRSPKYVPSGHLLFIAADSTLMAARLHIDRGEIDRPVPIVSGVLPRGGAVAMARSGRRLAYLSSTSEAASEALLVDRDGNATRFDPPWVGPAYPRVSPDGTRILAGNQGHVEVRSVITGAVTRLTSRDAANFRAEWFPDGERISFLAQQSAADRDEGGVIRDVFSRRVDLSEDRQLVFDHPDRSISQAVIGESYYVIRLGRGDPGTKDIWAVSRTDGTRFPVAAKEGVDERAAALSPDGRYVIYVSNETGRDEIWVSALRAGAEESSQVSLSGGTQPVWSDQGDEIFYQNGSLQLVAVAVRTDPEFELLSGETVLFSYTSEDVNHPAYDVTPDGQEFVMIGRQGRGDLVIIDSFLELLNRSSPDR